jgi:hypothetical protein
MRDERGGPAESTQRPGARGRSSRRPHRAVKIGTVDWAAIQAIVGSGRKDQVAEAAEDWAAATKDMLAEGTGELFELANRLHDLAASPDHLPVGHNADAHGAEFADPALSLVMPFLMAAFDGWVAAGDPEHVRLVKARFYARARLALHIGRLPTVVDPAVSFARGSCCIVMVSPRDEVEVVPGGNRGALKRQYRLVLDPSIGLLWASLMRKQPAVSLTARQSLELDAWQSITVRQRRQPLIALIYHNAGSAAG